MLRRTLLKTTAAAALALTFGVQAHAELNGPVN
jgi:hypothetical protein